MLIIHYCGLDKKKWNGPTKDINLDCYQGKKIMNIYAKNLKTNHRFFVVVYF